MITRVSSRHNLDTWITECFDKLVERIKINGIYNKDAFQNAYLLLRENLEADTDKNLENLFMAAYKKTLKRQLSDCYREFKPTTLFFERLCITEPTEQEEAEVSAKTPYEQAQDIKQYVHRNMTHTDIVIFDLKYSMWMSLRDISQYTGQSSSTVWHRLNDINSRIIQRFAM